MQTIGPEYIRTLVLIRDARRATRNGSGPIKTRQSERLRTLVAFARSRSRYYQDLYCDLPERITDIRELPFVTKAALMARFDDWVTDPAVTKAGVEAFVADVSRVGDQFLGRYTVWTTSGVTGTPALLVQDEQSISVMIALGVARALPAWLGHEEVYAFLTRGVRGAIVFATGGHFMALTMAERARRRSSRLKGIGEVVSVLTPVPQLVARLNDLDPTILTSYASGLVLLAEEKAAGRLTINPILLLSTGESLTPMARRRVEEVFTNRVRETYGASEIQIAAFECRRGRLHVNSDWVILEPVDESYQPIASGKPSYSVLATSLSNRVQPIIRYDLGDRITIFPDACACGSPLPSIRVEGRTDEILTFRSQRGDVVHLLPTALTTSIAEIAGMGRFQLIQKGPDRLIVRLETQSGSDANEIWMQATKILSNLLQMNGLGNVRIERSPEAPASISRSGKLRQVFFESA
jgi:phenylacetate-CoA ligase